MFWLGFIIVFVCKPVDSAPPGRQPAFTCSQWPGSKYLLNQVADNCTITTWSISTGLRLVGTRDVQWCILPSTCGSDFKVTSSPSLERLCQVRRCLQVLLRCTRLDACTDPANMMAQAAGPRGRISPPCYHVQPRVYLNLRVSCSLQSDGCRGCGNMTLSLNRLM